MTDTTQTVLLDEDFNGYHREQDGGNFHASHWDARWNAAVTSDGDDGLIKSRHMDTSGQDSLDISFDLKAWLSSSHGDFEEQGHGGADSIAVYLVLDGAVTLLDWFTYVDGVFVGSETGQNFGTDSYSGISYEGIDLNGASTAQLAFCSELTACDEFIKLDNVKVTAQMAVPPADGFAGTQELLHEDFNGLHYPEQSDAVAGHTAWQIVNGKAFSTDCKEGQLTFSEVALDGHDAGALSFDIKVNCVGNFETGGWAGDFIKVQVKVDGGHWVTIDTLERDYHTGQFCGDQSGQTFGDDGMTTLTYETGDLGAASSLQYRLFSSVTASNEQIFVDNVKITADKTVCDVCGDDFTKVDFETSAFMGDSVEAGDIAFDQFEGVTITAIANGRDPGNAVTIEAEDFSHKSSAWTKHNGKASGDAHVTMGGDGEGAIQTAFTGDTGTYRIKIDVQDENDGAGLLDVYVGGHKVDTIRIEGKEAESGNTNGSDGGRFSTFEIDSPVFIENHEAVTLVYRDGGGERGRIDKVTFVSEDAAPDNRAMIFDADNPTGGDDDLRNGDGNVLIISEDLDSADPDDNAKGGKFFLDFDNPVNFASFTAIDTEEGGKVELFDVDGALIGEVQIARIADSAVQTVDLSAFSGAEVGSAIITLNGSGAIDDLCFEERVAQASAALGDFVFLDADADGIQDAGEVGIEGVTVTLTGGGADGVIGTGDDTTDTTTTDADGFYEFTDLDPGTEYQVSFATPDGFVASPSDVGTDDALDSDGLVTDVVTLAPGETNTTLDQGFYQLAGLGNFVFLDADEDGVQDAGEAGVDGVTVQLKDAAGTVIDTTTTANGGAYSFTALIPGVYSVAFVAPAGFAFTAPNVGDDALDSDADPANGMTQTVTLVSGAFDDTLDAGLIVPNTPPAAESDAAMVCESLSVLIDALGNDADDDGDALSVTAITEADADGVLGTTDDVTTAVAAGDTISLASGVELTINADGTFLYDTTGADDFDGLLLGEAATESFAYTITVGAATSEAVVDVTICGSTNLIETIDNSDPELAAIDIFAVNGAGRPPPLLNTPVSLDFENDAIDDSLGILGAPSFPLGYCVDRDRPINLEPTDAFVYLSTDDIPDVNFDGGSIIDKEENLDLLNWVLNQGFEDSFSYQDIQSAIWELVDDLGGTDVDSATPGTQLSAGAQFIVDEAFANGEGFVPDANNGDVLGLILQPVVAVADGFEANGQVYVVGIGLDDCECVM